MSRGMCWLSTIALSNTVKQVAIVERYASGRPRHRLPRARRLRRAARARRQIHFASLRPAGRHRRRPFHHCQLRARRRLRLDAGLHRGPRRYRLTNPAAARRRTGARHHRRPRPARPARARRRRSIAAIPAAPCACWAASSPRIPFISTLDRRRFTLAPADAPDHRAARRKWAPPSPPAPAIARPVTIHGADLAGIHFTPETPSAQVKSAVLLAGLQASGETSVLEPASTRDHTERALAAFGARSRRPSMSLRAGRRSRSRAASGSRAATLTVPGDISSAAFMAVAAAAMPGSDVSITDVGLNPSRAGAARRAEAFRRRRSRRRSKTTGTASRSGACGFGTARMTRPRDHAGRSAGGDRRAAGARHARHVRRQRHGVRRRRAARQGKRSHRGAGRRPARDGRRRG